VGEEDVEGVGEWGHGEFTDIVRDRWNTLVGLFKGAKPFGPLAAGVTE
jgi:hypothetical protein